MHYGLVSLQDTYSLIANLYGYNQQCFLLQISPLKEVITPDSRYSRGTILYHLKKQRKMKRV